MGVFSASDPGPDGASLPTARPLVVPKGLTIAALALLLMFVAVEGKALWNEWSGLQTEIVDARRMEVIGYPGIQPRYSYAIRPHDWFRSEGRRTFLWGGWVNGVGHSWFLMNDGDIDPALLSPPRGRDVQLAIDQAIVESEGGSIWARVPDQALVMAGTIGGASTAYPLLVLDKVGVVNDEVGDRPFLVSYNPLAPEDERAGVYESVVEGRRITMGTTGYFHEQGPMLYDRGTESLWVSSADGLKAVAGEHKGRSLRRVACARPVAWRVWRSQFPEGRLVVGADRSAAVPAE